MLTPSTSKAARAMLAWTQQMLADRAQIGVSTVADFERGSRSTAPSSIGAMEAAFIAGGARLLSDGQVQRELSAQPVSPISDATPESLVESADIIDWANRRGAQALFPELIGKLATMTLGPDADIRFPFGDSVQGGGWDGECVATVAAKPIPVGASGWELTVQKDHIAEKADADFAKRAQADDDATRRATTFVFVVARRWRQKKAWAKKQKSKGVFADVIVLDADDLVQWLAACPTVAIWLAAQIGRRPRSGVASLSETFEMWSRATKPALTADVILAGRDVEATAIYAWLNAPPSVLSVRADSEEEAAAFLPAALSVLPEKIRNAHLARGIAALTDEAARQLALAQRPLIIALSAVSKGFAETVASKGHHVYFIVGANAMVERGITLKRMRRYDVQDGLEAMGLSRERARFYAKRAGGSLAALRRIMADDVALPPRWVSEHTSHAAVAAMLIGTWTPSTEADTGALAQLAGEPYARVMEVLSPLIDGLDTPFRRSGNAIRRASAQDAWNALAPRLIDQTVDAFFDLALAVLREVDQRFADPQRLEHLVYGSGTRPAYSRELKRGIVETLNLMAMFPECAANLGRLDLSDCVARLVSELLDGASAETWWSVRDNFPGLAEAAPDEFLDAVIATLKRDDHPIEALMEEDGAGPFSREYISDMTSALERLAWSPDYFPKATRALAGLAAIDLPSARNGNRPASTLRQIFLPWHPQTFAKLEQRLEVIDQLRKDARYADVMWTLMLGLMPKGFDSSSYSSTPTWRTFDDTPEPVTHELLRRSEEELLSRLLADAGANVSRWIGLLTGLINLPESRQREVTDALRVAMATVSNDGEKVEARKGLREALHRHRQFGDAPWALPESVLAPLQAAYDALAPGDLVQRESWVFAFHPTPPDAVRSHEPHVIDEQNRGHRHRVALVLAGRGDAEMILAMADAAEAPVDLGIALVEVGISDALRDRVMNDALRSEDHKRREFARGIIVGGTRAFGAAWAAEALRGGFAAGWSAAASAHALLGLPASDWAWGLVEEGGADVAATYWKTVNVFVINAHENDKTGAVEKLLAIGRACDAVTLISQHGADKFSGDIVLRALQRAGRELIAGDGHRDSTMFGYYTGLALDRVVADEKIPREVLADLEWTYFPILDRHERRSGLLEARLAADASFFIDLVSYVYRADGDEEEATGAELERKRALAMQSYGLLERWTHVPGTNDAGEIDAAALNAWIDDARALAKEKKLRGVTDNRIGTILSAAKPEANGDWPPRAVRDVIERLESKELGDGLLVGERNRRGATTRGPLDGGEQERELKVHYEALEKKFRSSAPLTANILKRIATHYKYDAVAMDGLAEAVDMS